MQCKLGRLGGRSSSRGKPLINWASYGIHERKQVAVGGKALEREEAPEFGFVLGLLEVSVGLGLLRAASRRAAVLINCLVLFQQLSIITNGRVKLYTLKRFSRECHILQSQDKS